MVKKPLEGDNMSKPKIAVPIGDPAGIGPEIVLKSFNNKELLNQCDIVVVGNTHVLENINNKLSLGLTINAIENPADGNYSSGVVNTIHIDNIDMSKLTLGEVSGMCGKASYDYIEKSVKLAMNKDVDGIATTPIHKEALKAGNVDFIGHTEILGSLTSTADPLTMFEVDKMRIFFLTRHLSLKDAVASINKAKVMDYIERCTEALRKLGITEGTMAVAGLNPHSGDGGLFGKEEIDEITPAIEEMQKRGFDVVGPVPADSVFYMGTQGKYSCILSLYHDQGHIAAKTYDFHRTVALTNGMPILRTSVDHGTAFDIAGTGIASEVSMIEAIQSCAKYAPYFTGGK